MDKNIRSATCEIPSFLVVLLLTFSHWGRGNYNFPSASSSDIKPEFQKEQVGLGAGE